MRTLRACVNWLVLLSLPVWGGLFLVGIFLYDLWAFTQLDHTVKRIATGRQWFWEA